MDLTEFTLRFYEQQHKVDRLIADSITVPRKIEVIEDLSDEELESLADEQECLEIDREQGE